MQITLQYHDDIITIETNIWEQCQMIQDLLEDTLPEPIIIDLSSIPTIDSKVLALVENYLYGDLPETLPPLVQLHAVFDYLGGLGGYQSQIGAKLLQLYMLNPSEFILDPIFKSENPSDELFQLITTVSSNEVPAILRRWMNQQEDKLLRRMSSQAKYQKKEIASLLREPSHLLSTILKVVAAELIKANQADPEFYPELGDHMTEKYRKVFQGDYIPADPELPEYQRFVREHVFIMGYHKQMLDGSLILSSQWINHRIDQFEHTGRDYLNYLRMFDTRLIYQLLQINRHLDDPSEIMISIEFLINQGSWSKLRYILLNQPELTPAIFWRVLHEANWPEKYSACVQFAQKIAIGHDMMKTERTTYYAAIPSMEVYQWLISKGYRWNIRNFPIYDMVLADHLVQELSVELDFFVDRKPLLCYCLERVHQLNQGKSQSSDQHRMVLRLLRFFLPRINPLIRFHHGCTIFDYIFPVNLYLYRQVVDLSKLFQEYLDIIETYLSAKIRAQLLQQNDLVAMLQHRNYLKTIGTITSQHDISSIIRRIQQ